MMMEENSLFFTICIPTYNRGYVIAKCLDSLLSQTYKNFEVVVVDDGSSDNTEDVVKKYIQELNLVYIKKNNGGKHTALNIGIENARGYFFLILDSDDGLRNNALQRMHDIWVNDIKENEREKYCGIMGKCEDQNGKLLGKNFPQNGMSSSYVDFHYILGPKVGGFGDCCECVRSDLMKQYRYPILPHTRFVPESFIFDQIGCKYKLWCVNDVFKFVEYLEDGITLNNLNFIKKNYLGYLYSCVSKIDIVFKECKDIPWQNKISTWRDYFFLVNLDKNNEGERVSEITLLGRICQMRSLLSKLKSILIKG